MNKCVLITGASRGIGRATALKMASLGLNVIINYNKSKEEANALKEEIIQKYGVEVLVIKADVSIENEVKDMIDIVKEEYGKISCLVNNAGISLDNDFRDKNTNEFNQVISTNLLGTFLVTKYACSIMDSGSIINVSSNGAIDDNYPESMDYDASKAGVISLTHNFAKVLCPNIRVNAVAPGWIKTKMNEKIDPKFELKEQEKILLNRFGEAEEVANVIAFLASDEASYINNSVIRVDGGLK